MRREKGAATLTELFERASGFLVVVDEVAPRSVRAEPVRMERPAELCLVFRVPWHDPKFVATVRELALVAVLAVAVLLVRAAQLGLVAARVGAAAVRPLVHALVVRETAARVAAGHAAGAPYCPRSIASAGE